MKVLISGYGAMGKVIEACCKEDSSIEITDIIARECNNTFADVTVTPDVIIDFSHFSNLDNVINYAKANNVPCVLATTGYSDAQKEQIVELSKSIPVLFSANYSLGVNLLNRVIKEVAPILREKFDIEIIEKHHNKKADAPSGTAKMLVNSVLESGDLNLVYGRSGQSKRTPYSEIGIHAVRGGTLAGEHEVIFAGDDEVLSFKHEAFSKKIFANGAITAAKWLVGKEIGLYDMEDVLF